MDLYLILGFNLNFMDLNRFKAYLYYDSNMGGKDNKTGDN